MYKGKVERTILLRTPGGKVTKRISEAGGQLEVCRGEPPLKRSTLKRGEQEGQVSLELWVE